PQLFRSSMKIVITEGAARIFLRFVMSKWESPASRVAAAGETAGGISAFVPCGGVPPFRKGSSLITTGSTGASSFAVPRRPALVSRKRTERSRRSLSLYRTLRQPLIAWSKPVIARGATPQRNARRVTMRRVLLGAVGAFALLLRVTAQSPSP